jgi:site-specific DNA-cytosine methylase
MQPTVVHLFAGSGGCTLGFQRAGFRSLGSFDFDARACRDLERLTGGPAFCRDLAAMQPADLRELTGGECPDVVVMSPPCKSFSGCMPAGRATEVRYVDMSQLAVRGVFLALEAWMPRLPRLVLLENVPRIQSRGAELLAQCVALLQRYGYATDQRTHDCGVLGGLAQHRERFLLVARHMATCIDVLRKPRPQRVRTVGEVLLPLPSPSAEHGDEMHRLPLLSPLNWLRLAAIRAGKDWRDLPAAIRLGGEARRAGAYEVLDSDEPANVVRGAPADLRVGFAGPDTHSGHLGVEDPTAPAHTVTANARVQASRGAVADVRVAGEKRPNCYGVGGADDPALVIRGMQRTQTSQAAFADPRVGWDLQRHAGRPDSYGVARVDVPSLTVRGRQDVQSSRASVADPRLAPSATRFKGKLQVSAVDEPSNTITGSSAQPSLGACAVIADPRLGERVARQNGGFGVEAHDDAAHAVLGEGSVRNTRASVADPRLGCEPRNGHYGVLESDEPSGVILGAHGHDSGRGSVADPRLSYRSAERDAQADRRGGGGHSGRGDFGVVDLGAPAPTIRARHGVRQAPAAVVDERGWPVPTHELVREGDELVLYGPPIDLETKRSCYLVIRAPDGTWHRPLTDRELAVLQGFPVDCQLEGPSSSSRTGGAGRREHVGNAIPPPTSEAIAREAAATLRSSTKASFLVGGDVWVERATAGGTA